MSWSWRSKETYGDKSANFEGGEAEKPAADEGAEKKKKPKSIWEDTTDSWWDQYDRVRSTGGVGSSTTRDDSYRAYSYDDAFDDSDSRWYRQNSFRYDSYRDYSPSRLFRRSFTSIGFGSYSSYGDNELKNKAIQALRSLTRNANTVADRAAKITYSVKFSGGADSNGAAEVLASKTGKQQEQTIYVSPNELAKASTDDDTDAVIDALTGFVLLRVQISQSVSRNVIDAINNTSMASLPIKLAGELAAGRITHETVPELTAKYTDDYAAGLLTKGMLTRLSRRAVVKDWGGFAPYFVRHAKKFAAVREQLAAASENGKLSLELLTAQIVYNFVSDENPIPLDKEIEDIVAKHLGEELPAEKLLNACRALVTELRSHLAATDKIEAGKIETGLEEIMKTLSDSGTAGADARKDITEQLERVADFVDDLAEKARKSHAGSTTAQEKLRKLHEDTTQLKMLQKLIDAVRMFGTDDKVSGSMQAMLSPIHSNNESLQAHMRYAKNQIDNNLAHYAPRITDLLDRHALDPMAMHSSKCAMWPPTAPPENADKTREAVKSHIDELKKLEDRAKEIAAAELKRIRKEYAESHREEAHKHGEIINEFMQQKEKLEELAEQSRELASKHPTAETVYSSLKDALECLHEHVDAAAARKEAVEKLANSRNTRKTLDTICSDISRSVSREDAIRQELSAFKHNMTVRATQGMREFLRTADRAAQEAAVRAEHEGKEYAIDKEWRPNGINEFFENANSGQMDFQTALINETHRELLRTLIKQMAAFGKKPKEAGSSSEPDDSDGDPSESLFSTPFDGLSAAQKAQIRNVAASLGMDGRTLYQIMQQINDGTRETNAKAEKLGAQIKEKLIDPAAKLSPVDEQLFGEQVKNGVKHLLGAALETVHDEATHSVEEDFVAYLSHNDARPKVKILRPSKANAHAHKSITIRVRNENRRVIEQIREALIFQSSKRVGEVYGLTSGDLDDGSLHKLKYDSEYIWSQKTLTRLPDVAVGILVDQSGSMNCANKIVQARDMCIVLAEAVKQIPGVHLHIYGHTANRNGSSDLQLFEHYSSYGDAKSADLSGLGGIVALNNNYDGYAIKETAKRLALDPAKKKYLFVIADGLPSGSGYGGNEAERHVTSVCTYVRNKLKISTYAFGVGVHSPQHVQQFKTQYGENNIVFISTVKQALPKIVRFLRSVLHKERNFVDASVD